jgi:hemolysin activation/secretion protein
VILGLALVLAGAAVSAQVVERNPPPGQTVSPGVILGPNTVPEGQDDTPIGPSLRGVVLLAPEEAVHVGEVSGVQSSASVRLDAAEAQRVLGPFIGRPISRRLIAEMEAAIARFYRERSYPFVSLSTPEQEISGGTVQIRVLEFHQGRVGVTGVSRTPPAYVTDRVRLAAGDPINTTMLGQDLMWLNRYPFRQVQAIFTPGANLGDADLELAATESRPWRVYAGYANSGSPLTGWDRSFAGAILGGLLKRDSVLSYQVTISGDFFYANGDFPGNTAHPQYVSHGARLALPIAPRQQVEVAFDAVETNVTSGPFSVRQTTLDGTLGYRFALSNLARLPGDANFGVEMRHQERKTFFGGVAAIAGQVNVYQVYGGWSDQWIDPKGRTSLDVTVHVSPGGLGANNSASAFNAYTQGRVTHAGYAYVDVNFERYTRLPKRWALSNRLFAQVADRPAPDSEQIAVGGQALVRGYTIDDGAFDTGLVSRNELRAPSMSLVKKSGPMTDNVSPFAFVDVGWARDNFTKADAVPISAGLGADYQLGALLNANLSVAHALRDVGVTRSGDWMLNARVTISY